MAEDKHVQMIRRGRCHCFGDDVPVDDGIMPRQFAAGRVTDPAELVPHLFESIDPGFAGRVRPGDVLLAGRNFACGKPRLQGFIAMAELGLSVVCTSMPYRMLRRAVARGIPVLVGGPGPEGIAVSGDEIELDLAAGLIRNATRDTAIRVPTMPPILLDIVARGGMQAVLLEWLARNPEQAVRRD